MTHFINNEWIEATGTDKFFTTNPATGAPLFSGTCGQENEINTAIQSAQKAFTTWALLSLEERIYFLQQFNAQLIEQKLPLATMISNETGKPLWESLNELSSMIAKLEISIQAFHERTCEKIKNSQGHTLATRHRPHGVIAVLGPFNFPGHIPLGHILPALLSGNTIVFKPSEKTPLISMELAKLWQKANLPKGVFNIVQGGAKTGSLLAKHPRINGLFFTGSLNTGLALNKLFSATPEKILALELGGNNPIILWDSSDINLSVYNTIISAYITSGQRCTCARRLILPKNAEGDLFLAKLREAIQLIRVGEYTETPEPFMGPLISKEAAEALLQAEMQLVSKGGISLAPLQRNARSLPFLFPGLIDVTCISERKDCEFFGPLLQVIRVETFEEALQESTRTHYGLVTALFSDSPELYKQFFIHAKSGLVHWNNPTTGARSDAPFGGIGRSGNFRPSAYFAADYCSHPVVSLECPSFEHPSSLLPGIRIP